MSNIIVWFRRDLRLEHHPALFRACQDADNILPLYIFDTKLPHAVGAAQTWWLHHSLTVLSKRLQEKGLSLCLRRGNPVEILQDLITTYDINAIYYNHGHEPDEISRDILVSKTFSQERFQVINCAGSFLTESSLFFAPTKAPYKAFTPFWKKALSLLNIRHFSSIEHFPKGITAPSESVDDWHLIPQNPNWAEGFSAYWEPGCLGAERALNLFIKHHLNQYKIDRDRPDLNATSKLSPHLHFGEIAPQSIYKAIQHARTQNTLNQESVDCFYSELGWREYSAYLIYHFPTTAYQNHRTEFNYFPWNTRADHFNAWKKGLTGYPLVDAGMRELWQTGTMHNRIRMVVASFLVKDLLIDWQQGAAWFMETLLDADLASNAANWQWAAGSGHHAPPFFRVFNPILQSEKFDPKGDYIKQWVPELRNVPAQWIHEPAKAPAGALQITLGADYPYPMVDHKEARQKALTLYYDVKAKLKQGSEGSDHSEWH